jgi:hypothetical protein
VSESPDNRYGTDGRSCGDVVAEVCESLVAGLDLAAACGLARVPYRTMRTWMSRHDWVALEIEHARGRDVATLVAAMRDPVCDELPTRLKRITTELERKYPAAWGTRQALEVSGPEGGAQEHAITITLAEAERIAAESDEED